jgi:hypothetical protein
MNDRILKIYAKVKFCFTFKKKKNQNVGFSLIIKQPNLTSNAPIRASTAATLNFTHQNNKKYTSSYFNNSHF